MDAAQLRFFQDTGVEVERDQTSDGFVTLDSHGPRSLNSEQATLLMKELLLCAHPPKPMTEADWHQLVDEED